MAGRNREAAGSEEPESLQTIGNLPTPNSRGSAAGSLVGHSKTARCRSFPSRHGGRNPARFGLTWTPALRQAQGKLYAGVTMPAILISMGGPPAHGALRTLGFLAVPCQSD